MAKNRSSSQIDVQQAIERVAHSSILHRFHRLLQNTDIRYTAAISVSLRTLPLLLHH